MITTIEKINRVSVELYEHDLDDAAGDYKWSSYEKDFFDTVEGEIPCFIGNATPRAWLVIDALTNTAQNATIVMPLRVEATTTLSHPNEEWSIYDLDITAVHWEYLDSYEIFSDKPISADAEDVGRMQDKVIAFVRENIKDDTDIVEVKAGKHPFGEFMHV